MVEVMNKLERDAMGGKKIKWLLLQVSWIRDDSVMKEGCAD